MSPPVLQSAWAMPNADPFRMPPIADLLHLFAGKGDGWADPFAGTPQHENGLNLLAPTRHGEATDFLARFPDDALQGVILDPSCRPLQIRESGEGMAKARDGGDANFIARVKDIAAKKIVPGGLAICCGPNSNGLGTQRGFELIHVLDVRHGGDHADTVVTVEIKVPYQAADDPSVDDLAAERNQDQPLVGKDRLMPTLQVAEPARGRGDHGHGVEPASSRQAPNRPLRLRDVVRVSGRSASTIRRAIKDGLLQVHKVGRGKRRPTYEVHPADLQRYIEASRVESPDSPSIPTVKVRRKSRHFD